ncbi:MAG: glycogen synthase, partial [Planctomycetaceae bacterium]
TRGLEQTASVMTIHNLAYQGQFQDYEFPLTGMPRRYYNMYQMEAWGQLNLLKTGLSFADQLTTVSPSYADEICLPENGCGLDGVLRHRQSDLVGILNGIDEQIWDPAADPMISANYTLSSRASGKATCKQKLQEVFGLDQDPTTPLLGMVTRLADQKGLDLIAAGIERILAAGVQFVFLGTGDARYEQLLSALPRRFSVRIGGRIGFDEAAAHQIEAGSDMFLMPSRFEPCGLNQMYSLRYGTVPVVRGVGGLADSVIDYDGQPGTLDRATGFAFREYSTDQLVQTIVRAVASYRQPDVWSRLVDNGMRQDWSWDRSAAAYLQVYERALQSVSSRQQAGRS